MTDEPKRSDPFFTPEMTLEDLRRIVDEARAGGVSNQTLENIIADGDRVAKARDFYRE